MARFKDLCLDVNDHQALADWWCGVLGYVRKGEARQAEWPIPIVDVYGDTRTMLADPEGNEFCVFAES